jgi:VWFA-related protein
MRLVPRRALLLVLILSIAPCVTPLGGQAQPQKGQAQPTFRMRIEFVEVDASVRDKSGHFVADLTKDDFEVLEDGKRQDIASFDLVNVPVEPRPAVAVVTGRLIEPDVVSNKQVPGRVYLVVIDDLHVSPMRIRQTRKVARDFIEQNVAPNDVAMVLTTSGNRQAAQDFTSNKRLLLQAVDRVVGRKVTSPGAAAISTSLSPGIDPTTTAGIPDPGARERIFNARTTLEALTQIATFAGTIRNRRKAIVMVGEGIDYNFGKSGVGGARTPTEPDQLPIEGFIDEGSAPRLLRDTLKTFVDAANRANVTLYALDPSVFTQGGDDLVDIASGPPGNSFTDKDDREISRFGKLRDDVEAAQDNLRTLATETGGFAATGSPKNILGAFDRIREENSRYYILGYYPTNAKRDGKYRQIALRVKRPGVEVVARKGYVAPKNQKVDAASVETKEGTSAPLREALLAALPTVGLPISVVAAPFRGSAGNASVLVMLQTPPGAVRFVEKNGRFEGNLEVSFVAMDYQGKTRGGERLEFTMPLKPETAEVVSHAGLLVQSRVTLPPGRYVLRVGARDANSELVGAVHCDVEVPDYAKLPVSMSGVILASAETATANPRPDPELGKLVAEVPAVIREFRRTDEISALAEIYDAKLATPHNIDIVTTVVGEDGREVFRREETRSTSQIQAAWGGFGYLMNVPLATIAPGAYLLRIEATSRLDANSPVARDTMFTVVSK